MKPLLIILASSVLRQVHAFSPRPASNLAWFQEEERKNWPESLSKHSKPTNVTVHESDDLQYIWEYQVTQKTNEQTG